MPRNTPQQNRQIDEMQRQVITQRPHTVTGGFFPPALIPILAAAAAPVAAKAGNWVGKKIFGSGVLRTGEKPPPLRTTIPHVEQGPTSAVGRPVASAPTLQGAGRAHYRAGNFPMPSLRPIQHTSGPLKGGVLMQMPGIPEPVKKAIRTITTVGGSKKTRAKRQKPKSKC